MLTLPSPTLNIIIILIIQFFKEIVSFKAFRGI